MAQRGILAYGAYLPYQRLDRDGDRRRPRRRRRQGHPHGRLLRRGHHHDGRRGGPRARCGRCRRRRTPDALSGSPPPTRPTSTRPTRPRSTPRCGSTATSWPSTSAAPCARASARCAPRCERAEPTLVVLSDVAAPACPTSADETPPAATRAGRPRWSATTPTDRSWPSCSAAAGATEEFLDRWRSPATPTSRAWEERFGEVQYAPLGRAGLADALKQAGHHRRRVDRRHRRRALTPGRPEGRRRRWPGRARRGGRRPLRHRRQHRRRPRRPAARRRRSTPPQPGQVDRLVVAGRRRRRAAVPDHRRHRRRTARRRRWRPRSPAAGRRSPTASSSPGAATCAASRPAGPSPPAPRRRRAAARTGSSASSAAADRDCGAVHLPPAAGVPRCGAVDDMEPAPMADVAGHDRHVHRRPARLLAEPAGRVRGRRLRRRRPASGRAHRRRPADVAIGDRVEMTFRRLFTADGIHNYFWKAGPSRRSERDLMGSARHQGPGRDRRDGLHAVRRALGQGRRRPARRRRHRGASPRPGIAKDDVDAYWLGTAQSGMSGITLSRPLSSRTSRSPGSRTSAPPAPRRCATPRTRWRRARTTWRWRSASRR